MRIRRAFLIQLMTFIVLTSFCIAQRNEVSADRFPVRVGNLYGYINSKGEMVIKPQFDSAKRFHDGLALVSTGGRELDRDAGFTERMFGKYGYINLKGEFVIPPRYDIAEQFSEGLAAVWMKTPCSRSCFGYIDTKGKTVLPQKYQTAGAFHDGTADVRMADDRWE